MNNKKLVGIIVLCLLWVECAFSWESKIVYFNNDGKLVYVADGEGNRIPDFSHAGYKGGDVPIPDIPVVKTIAPIAGDNTSHIQSALFEIGLLPKGSDGFRGALLLTAGTYEIRGTIKFGVDGVVLRGVGDGADTATNTILWATGNSPNQRTVLVAGGGAATKWGDEVPNTRTDIITDSVLVGSNVFEVADASKFSIGDNIIIYHPCTAEWLAAIDSGGTYWYLPGAEPGVDVPWEVGSQPIVFNRFIKDIQGNIITIDTPVFNHLIRSLSQSYIYKYSRSGLRTQIGIENLRIDIETRGGVDEAHAWTAIDLFQIEDAWVRNCTMLHFGHSGVRTNTATRITIENCKALDPVSQIEGERRYNFNVYTASQQVLFKNCHASNGRHHYVSNGTSWTSGCVFLDCTSQGAYTSSEGHRRWSTGLLWDNVIELDGPRPGYNPRLLGLYNRGHYGTSHGWGLAHSVAWNCDVAQGDLIVQQPPTAQNYAIGCKGKNVTGKNPPAPFDAPDGYIEGTNESGLEPRSLYEAQLAERLATQVSIGQTASDIVNKPVSFVLYQNYPNPFNPTTNIQFDVFRKGLFTISIYNIRGEKIQSLISENLQPGSHQIQWQATDLPSGVYFMKMDHDGSASIRKILLIK
jgi:hypothetical protein